MTTNTCTPSKCWIYTGSLCLIGIGIACPLFIFLYTQKFKVSFTNIFNILEANIWGIMIATLITGFLGIALMCCDSKKAYISLGIIETIIGFLFIGFGFFLFFYRKPELNKFICTQSQNSYYSTLKQQVLATESYSTLCSSSCSCALSVQQLNTIRAQLPEENNRNYVISSTDAAINIFQCSESSKYYQQSNQYQEEIRLEKELKCTGYCLFSPFFTLSDITAGIPKQKPCKTLIIDEAKTIYLALSISCWLIGSWILTTAIASFVLSSEENIKIHTIDKNYSKSNLKENYMPSHLQYKIKDNLNNANGGGYDGERLYGY